MKEFDNLFEIVFPDIEIEQRICYEKKILEIVDMLNLKTSSTQIVELYEKSYDSQESEYEHIWEETTKEYQYNLFIKDILVKYYMCLVDIIGKAVCVNNKSKLISSVFQHIFCEIYELAINTLIVEVQEKMNTEVWENNPELLRLIHIRATNSCVYLKEIIDSVEDCLAEIQSIFGKDKKYLDNIFWNKGDTHNGGRSVVVVSFNDGKRLVYKPHSLEMELLYSKINAFFASKEKSDYKNLLQLKVISKEKYGFVEYIDTKECESISEVKDYYFRMGEVLAMLFAMNSTDFHYENVLACGSCPVLVDMETFVHSTYDTTENCNNDYDLLHRVIRDSVLRTGILPTQIVNPKISKSVEVGALGNSRKTESAFYSKRLERDKGGNLKIVKYLSQKEEWNNLPMLNGERQEASGFLGEIIDGFILVYQLIQAHKDSFLSLIGDELKDKKVRMILRATNTYYQVLETSYNPSLQRDLVSRGILLMKIASAFPQYPENIWKEEILDMLNGDIPYFYCVCDKDRIFNRYGELCGIQLPKTIISEIEDRVQRMCVEDLFRQLSFIRISFLDEIPFIDNYFSKIKITDFEKKALRSVSEKDLLNRIIGILLSKKVIYVNESGQHSRWLEVKRYPSLPTSLGCSNNSIYSGRLGIFFVLKRFFELCVKEKNEAVLELQNEIDEEISRIKEIEDYSIFAGQGGYLYYLVKENKGVEIIEEFLAQIDVNCIDNLDYIYGVSGLLKVLVLIRKKYSKVLSNDLVEGKMEECIHRIYKESIDNGVGEVYWKNGDIGYAHGSAGIIAALTSYYSLTKDRSIEPIIEKGYRYILSCYDSKRNNWWTDCSKKTISLGWCHGPAGIAMLQHDMICGGVSGNVLSVADLKKTCEIIINNGLERDYCLCHGGMGNLMILQKCVNYVKDESLKKRYIRMYQSFLLEQIPIIMSDYYSFFENNSFMVGLAGLAAGIMSCSFNISFTDIMFLE